MTRDWSNVLTEDERLAISHVVHQNYYMPDVFKVVAGIKDAAVEAERERIATAIENDPRYRPSRADIAALARTGADQ